MTTLEAIESLTVTDLTTSPTKGILIIGGCLVNGTKVLFGYNPKLENFTVIVASDKNRFSYLGENWMYRIGCAIKRAIK